MVNGSEPPPVRLCYSYYAGGIENNTYVFDSKEHHEGTVITQVRIKLLQAIKQE